jgi:hypothetical protein
MVQPRERLPQMGTGTQDVVREHGRLSIRKHYPCRCILACFFKTAGLVPPYCALCAVLPGPPNSAAAGVDSVLDPCYKIWLSTGCFKLLIQVVMNATALGSEGLSPTAQAIKKNLVGLIGPWLLGSLLSMLYVMHSSLA